MPNYYLEQRVLSAGRSLSADLAHHLFIRQLHGLTIIVSEHPDVMMPALKKQWHKVARQARRERSQTLDPYRKLFLQNLIERAHTVKFGIFDRNTKTKAQVVFVPLEQLSRLGLQSRSIYVAQPPEDFARIERSILPHGLVVIYD